MPRLQRYIINLSRSWGGAPGFYISRLWRFWIALEALACQELIGIDNDCGLRLEENQ